MRAVKYLLAPWAGVVVYVLLSINFGAMGFSPYQRLLQEKEREEKNLEQLKLINQELEHTKNALLYDSDTLMVQARELGFSKKNEKFIRVVGLEDPYKRRSSPGETITASQPEYIPDTSLRILACCAAAGILVVLLLGDMLVFLRGDD